MKTLPSLPSPRTRPHLLLAFWLLASCSGSSPSSSPDIPLTTQIDISATPPELATTVHIDSVSWRPRLLLPDPFAPTALDLELTGSYTIFFRNSGQEPLQLRYDLRFFDIDEFFIDVFNPFGLPLLLQPGQTLRHGDAFEIRADDPRQLETLATMRITLRIQKPPDNP